MPENSKGNQRKQKKLPNPEESEEQQHHRNQVRGNKTPYPNGREKNQPPLVKPGRDKNSKARAWRTRDREEGGEKPPSPDEHDSNSSSLSL
jgi:hypothetical protein